MFPKMVAEPCSSCVGRSPRWVFSWSCVIPDICHHVLYPSLCLISIEVFRCLLSARYHIEHQVGKRKVKLAQVTLLRYPVIHLHIYICVIISVPWRLVCIGPETLEIWRKTAFTGTADQEVTAVVVVECSQMIVLCSF